MQPVNSSRYLSTFSHPSEVTSGNSVRMAGVDFDRCQPFPRLLPVHSHRRPEHLATSPTVDNGFDKVSELHYRTDRRTLSAKRCDSFWMTWHRRVATALRAKK